ncbi:unnamed protein product [Aphis gossypii]|uniref:Uncharacterized protein n=1 Tax=Aphis gossypii TaxID=80765 RepID=A0A9P0ILZ3_APHGO|nr:unnamed protein product [Aphis gossypii]
MGRRKNNTAYKLRSGINPDDVSMESDTNQSTHDDHVFLRSHQNEQQVVPNELNAINKPEDASRGASAPDVNTILQLLMEQNRMLMEQLNMSKTVVNEQPSQFYVMPNLNKNISSFTGRETGQVARDWLKNNKNNTKITPPT